MKIWLTLLLALAAMTALSQPAQVVVIRHAEKPANVEDDHLSAEGRARAKALVKFFTTNKKVLSFGTPAVFYANHATKHGHGQRSYETLEPTAEHYKLQIETPYESEAYEKIAQHILKNPALAGKTVVICWTHEYLPVLANALGVEPMPAKWKDSVFDKAYLITYRKTKKPVFEIINQGVLPGDTKYKGN